MSIHLEADFVGDEWPLTHPRICGMSVVGAGTIAVTNEQAGFEGVNAADPRGTSFWKPSAVPANFQVTMAADVSVSYFAIYGHDLGTVGGSVTLQKSNGLGGFEDVSAAITPASNDPLIFLCKPFESSLFRLVFAGAIPTIGVIYIGKAIEVPVRAYTSIGTPANLARKTEFTNNRATKGAFMGRSIKRQLNMSALPIEHVTEYWVQNTLDPFIQDAISNPYFVAENPHQYPAAVQYKWTSGDIIPERLGLKNLMKVTV